jgi:hypothetical protein
MRFGGSPIGICRIANMRAAEDRHQQLDVTGALSFHRNEMPTAARAECTQIAASFSACSKMARWIQLRRKTVSKKSHTRLKARRANHWRIDSLVL